MAKKFKGNAQIPIVIIVRPSVHSKDFIFLGNIFIILGLGRGLPSLQIVALWENISIVQDTI